MKDEPKVQAIEDGTTTSPPDFTTFMRNYQDMVYSTAFRLVGQGGHAEDIAQEVFLKAYERFDQLQTSPSAGGWLKTVATNLSINHLQRYRKRWKFFSEFTKEGDEGDEHEVEFASSENFLTGLDQGERRIWVEECLAKLPDHQRIPLVLYHFEELSYEDIARRLGVSLAKVKTDILRAREALAKVLLKSGARHEKFQN
ncbi:MAG TPA: RNA polymerase sigma factor [Opitutaceae bacterium]|nr:RNA polymerase sigma factor [Opitutaceae bacterium]